MRIVILGNGISGITAARFARKQSDHDITVISDESDYFFSRTALMYVYMGHLRFQDIQPYEPWFWEKNRIQLVRARIERIDFQEKKLYSNRGETFGYDKLLLASGSRSNKFGWPGQDLDGVHGLYHLSDLQAMEQYSALSSSPGGGAVIVGGGLIGVEMAEMFHSRGIPVTFLVREPAFWSAVLPPEEAAMVGRHLREHHIDLRLETELQEILPDKSGKRCGAVVTNRSETIPCGFVGLTVGVSPNIAFLKNTELETNRGILVDDFLQTNIPGVFAAGDCAELRRPGPGRNAIEAVWYTGRMMGEVAAHNLTAQPPASNLQPSTLNPQPSTFNPQPSTFNLQPYAPGIWFNSAKFFDLEYQVYGDIRARLPEDQATLYWEHPGGKKSIRLNYEKQSGRVLGFNLMGVRYRQEVCEKWIAGHAHLETVLPQLGMANFDPEFYPQHEAELVAQYNRQSGKNLRLKQKRGLEAVLEFLK